MSDIVQPAQAAQAVNEERRRRWRQAAIYAALALVTFVMVFPILWMISVSLKPTTETFSLPPRLLPETFHWDGYAKVLTDPKFRSFLINSYVVGLAVTALSLVIGTLAAFGFFIYVGVYSL